MLISIGESTSEGLTVFSIKSDVGIVSAYLFEENKKFVSPQSVIHV